MVAKQGLAPVIVPRTNSSSTPIPTPPHSLAPLGSLGGQVMACELTGAVHLGVQGPGPGQPPSSDSIHPERDGQLVSVCPYAALTTPLDAANTGVMWQLRWTAAVAISGGIGEGQM